MPEIKQLSKQRYNLTYRAKAKGLKVNGRKKWIIIYFEEFVNLIHIPEAMALLRDHNFQLKQNRQLKLKLK